MKKNKAAIVFLIVFIALAGCGGKQSPVIIEGETMGTTYSVKIADAVKSKDALKTSIDSLLYEVNMKMSTYIPESEISKFNGFRDTTWFAVSPEFLLVAKAALEVSRETNGYYDITVGPLVNLWGFGPAQKKEIVPTQKELDSVKKFVGFTLLEIRDNPPAIRKKDARVYVDFSSIAKGYGVDAVSELLLQKGFRNHLVEIGGELRASGRKTDGSPWLVGVENPSENGIAIAVKLENKSIATSGDYHNYFEFEGKRFSHTINPKTCKPVTHNLASVSVIAENCMLADAYATALDVMGPEKSFEFAEKENLPIYVIFREEGIFRGKMNDAFRNFIKE